MNKLTPVYVTGTETRLAASPAECAGPIARSVAAMTVPGSDPAEAEWRGELEAAVLGGIRQFAVQTEFWMADRLALRRGVNPYTPINADKAVIYDNLKEQLAAVIAPTTPAERAEQERRDQEDSDAHRWRADQHTDGERAADAA